MAVTRRTDNAELYNDITLSVAPLNGGSVGINEPNPIRGTLQIENTYVRNIGGAFVNGDLKTTNFQNDLAGQGNSSTTLAQFYREGSRVYMDGKLEHRTFPGTWSIVDWNVTLPEFFRPLKTERFAVPCRFLLDGTAVTYHTFGIEVRPTGQVYGSYIADPNSSTATPVLTAAFADNTVPTGTNWFSLAGVNFRVA